MKRSTFVIFGIVVLVFAVLIPAWAISREGSSEASPESVPASLDEGKDLFVTNCGACHTLAKAGTDGVVGPNLDETKPSKELTVDRVTNGLNAMPSFASQLSPDQIDAVAEYISESAGK